MDDLRPGSQLERDGLCLDAVGKRWKSHLEAISFDGSPLEMLGDPLSANLWRGYRDLVQRYRRKAKSPETEMRLALIARVADEMRRVTTPEDEYVQMDLQNWIYEMRCAGVAGADDDTLRLARELFYEFQNRELIDGKGIGS